MSECAHLHQDGSDPAAEEKHAEDEQDVIRAPWGGMCVKPERHASGRELEAGSPAGGRAVERMRARFASPPSSHCVAG